jgi:hypothetical protein
MDIKSWPKKWNDASLRDIATLPEFSPSRPWSLLGMLALGLVAGAAIGGYAASQRSQLKRLSTYAHRLGDELAAEDVEAVKPVVVATSPRSNHRRKAAARI